MKNRKRIITTLIGMTLTAQLSPVAYTVVNAQEPTASQIQGEQQKTGLSDTKITLGGNGCWETPDPSDPKKAGRHEVQISFIDGNGNGKLHAEVLSGYKDDPNHSFHEYCPEEYLKIELIDAKTKKIKQQAVISGKDNIGKFAEELNTWEFKYNDYLRLFHGEANDRTKITGTVIDGETKKNIQDYATTGVRKDILKDYQFRITKEGLVQEKQNIKEIESADQLIKELKDLKRCLHQETIKIKNDIKFSADDVSKITELNSEKKSELTIPEGVTLVGDNNSKKVSLDFSGKMSLVLKGNYTGIENIDILNSNGTGVHVYDSDYSSIKRVSVTGSTGYAIHVNGSTVAMQDCTTRNNELGGVLISTSIDLNLRRKKSHSNVIFKGNSNTFNENKKILVKNLQIEKKNGDLIKEIDNTFKVEYPKMRMDKVIDNYTPSHKCSNTPALSEESKNILEQNHINSNDAKIQEDFIYYNYNV